MLQQTATEKPHHSPSILDAFSAGYSDKREHEKDLKYLKDDYSAALQLAADLSSHAKWIPYPFLINRLKKIADEVRTKAELLRIKIVELGGAVPQSAVENREDVEFRVNVRRLAKDMEAHAAFSELLVHQKNNIRDAGVLKIIEMIASEMQNQKDELMDIVMRLS